MNIASIQCPVFKPYNKPAIEVYVSGCNRGCTNCHNPELSDFKYGKKLDIDLLIQYLTKRESLFEIISITGGDLLCQNATDAFFFSFKLKGAFPTKELWLFTGENDIKDIPLWATSIYNIIKYGAYKEELKQEGFPASSNQKIWKKHIETKLLTNKNILL